jgi:hypothetical protein
MQPPCAAQKAPTPKAGTEAEGSRKGSKVGPHKEYLTQPKKIGIGTALLKLRESEGNLSAGSVTVSDGRDTRQVVVLPNPPIQPLAVGDARYVQCCGALPSWILI